MVSNSSHVALCNLPQGEWLQQQRQQRQHRLAFRPDLLTLQLEAEERQQQQLRDEKIQQIYRQWKRDPQKWQQKNVKR